MTDEIYKAALDAAASSAPDEQLVYTAQEAIDLIKSLNEIRDQAAAKVDIVEYRSSEQAWNGRTNGG